MKAAVYESNGEGSELTGLSSLKVNIIRSSRVICAPVESGQNSFDNKVLDPTKVVVTGAIPVRPDGLHLMTIARLNRMWANRDWEFYYASDGVNSQNNLILQTFPTIRDVDKFDFINVELTFVEAMMVSSEMSSPSNSDNTNCRNSGMIQGVRM